MRRTPFILSLILAIVGTQALRSAEVPLRRYTPETVLIQSQVNEIVQDSRGFIWVGTMGGINVFTGARVYTLTKANGLDSEWIRCIVEVTPNTMWVGTNSGMGYVQNAVSDSVHFLKKTAGMEIRDIVGYQNKIYVATMLKGLHILQGDSLKPVSQAQLPDGTMLMDIAVWDGKLWLATNTGLRFWDGQKLMSANPDNFILHLTPSENGLWCASSDGLYLRRPNGINWIIKDETITDISITGETLAATIYGKGVVRFKLNHPEVQELISQENGLPGSFFRAVCLDHQGNLWLGTDGAGLIQIFSYEFETFTATSGLENERVNSICRVLDTLLVGTDQGVFYSVRGERFHPLKNGQVEHVVCVRPFTGNKLLVAYESRTELYNWPQNGELIPYRRLLDFAVTDVLIQGDNTWLATEKGLRIQYPDGHYKAFAQMMGFSSMNCHALAENPDHGGVLVATDRGLNYLSNGVVSVFELNRKVWDVAVDFSGRIWLGTDAGVIVLNSSGERLAWYTQEDGLLGSTIYSVSIATDSTIWLGTNQGIVRIKDEDVFSFVNENGLPSNEMVNGANWVDDFGVWIGSVQGLIHFPPGLDLPAREIRVVPYQFWQNELPVPQWDSELSHDHPVLTVDLGAPDFLNSAVEFQYRFMNHPEDWIPLGANTQLTLSGLPPGSYDIGIQAAGISNHHWGPIYHLPLLMIRPPFYQRLGFQLFVLILSVLFFSGVTYASTRYKHERKTMKRQEEEIALAHEFNQRLAATVLPTVDENWLISVDFKPRNEFSGDFYYAFRGRGERFCILVGDVSGSGLETSYMNGFIKMSLQSKDWAEATMTAWLEEINQALYRLPRTGLNLALTTVVVDETNGQTFYLSAGNPPPFMVNGSGRVEYLKPSPMPPLGVFSDWKPVWQELAIGPGSLLGLHSDGLEQNISNKDALAPMSANEIIGLDAAETLQTLLRTRWLIEQPDDRLFVVVNRLRKPPELHR